MLMEFYFSMKSHDYLVDLILKVNYHEFWLSLSIDLKIQEIDYVEALKVHHQLSHLKCSVRRIFSHMIVQWLVSLLKEAIQIVLFDSTSWSLKRLRLKFHSFERFTQFLEVRVVWLLKFSFCENHLWSECLLFCIQVQRHILFVC